MSEEENALQKKKSHRERHSGRKAEKKKAKSPHVQELTDKQKNPKAFTFNSAIRAERRFRRKQDIETKRQHIPLIDRTPLEPPPVIVAVVGPPKLKKTKKTLKHRFWSEVYAGAKLFYLSGLLHEEYMRNEVKNLGRSFVAADRVEDLTSPELIRQNPKVDRLVSLYGYVRGVALNKMSSVHIPGCGDLKIHDVSHLPDPCPLPDKLKKRTLVEKERLIYAPFSGIGGIVYDKDAVYVELGGSHSFREKDDRPEKALVDSLRNAQETLDVKMARSELQLFSGAPSIVSAEVKENTVIPVNDSGRLRRKVVFADEEEESEDAVAAAEKKLLQVTAEDSEDEVPVKKRKLVDTTRYHGIGNNEDRAVHSKVSSLLSQLEEGVPVAGRSGDKPQSEECSDSDGDEDVGGLFRVVKKKQQRQQEQRDLMNSEDCSTFVVKQVRDWMDSGVCDIVRDCFVTGKWKESEDAEDLLRLDDASEDECFGDFEDLETGEKHSEKVSEKGDEVKNMSREELQEKKRKLKEKFDAEYDDKDGGKTYYDELKQEVDHQAQLNKNEFEGLDDGIRIQLEGYRPGMYVRVEVANVPCELIANFDPTYPLILGGLQAGEENIGFIQADFRIAATGSVVELDKSTQIMKKLKLTGTPYKIYKKTAFIRDMFNSTLEVAKFEGARLKTVSGIRGQIKKAVTKPEGAFRATFEDKILLSDIVFCRTWYRVEVPKLYNPVTSLLLSPEQKNLWRGMKTVGQLKRERGIRGEAASDSLGSFFKLIFPSLQPIERKPKAFHPLVIPRSLQKELPYKEKPKNVAKKTTKAANSGRIAVVREPHERKVASLMKMLKVSFGHKQEQLKQATKERMLSHKKDVEQEQRKKLQRHKELRKQVFRTLSKMSKTQKK
ncbi:hypothetical protein C0J52_12602 [Blattella germanica]|nr:hypothetical protein C0J52_12602 [Blattella germanica]